MRFANEIKILLAKDLKIEYRNKLEVGLLTVFSISTGAIIGYISREFLIASLELIAGMIILTQLFLSIFASWKSFIRELERGTLNGILLTSVSPSSLFYSKLLLSVLIIELTSLLSIASSAFFSGGLISPTPQFLFGVLTMGVYLSAVSSFASVIGVYVESRGILVPLVIFVLSLPASIYYVSSMVYTFGLLTLFLLSLAYGFVITSIVDMVLGEPE